MSIRLLAVDDDDKQRTLLKELFAPPDFLTRCEASGEKGLECAFDWRPNIVILDMGLPGIGGLEVCRLLRNDDRTRAAPIIVLSARQQKEQIIQALNAGVDDYLTKPFAAGELLARVQALLRRYPAAEINEPVLKFGPVTLDRSSREVFVAKKPVTLSPKEFDLLEVLMRSEGRVLSRQHLLQTVWGFDSVITPRTVDNHVASLRKKLGPAVAKSIHTLFKTGYRLGSGV